MNLGETLRKLIKDNINSTRPFFGYVIEQNADKTWVIQPIDDQPVVNNVQTFQTEIDGNDPIIGSLVLCIFIDDYNSYITEIIEYNTWFVNAEESSTLSSQNSLLLYGKKVFIGSSTNTVEENKTLIDNLTQNNNFLDESIAIVADKEIYMSAKENVTIGGNGGDNNIFLTSTAFINSSKLDYNIKSEKKIGIISDDSCVIDSLKTVLISGKGTIIDSNGILLNALLTDIVSTLNTLASSPGAVLPALPLVPGLLTKLATYNS
jgi:hypothetical protein